MLRFKLLMTILLAAVSGTAIANTVHFTKDPFADTTVLNSPGRQIVGGEMFLPDFSTAHDVFSFDAPGFGMTNPLGFANGLAASLPASGANVIVLDSTDNDNNPLTPFGAGNAADLIAAQVTQPGPGVFIYMNSSLNLLRLVYSTDLSDNNADLRILARILNPIGQRAIDELPGFTAANFEIGRISTVPEPSTFGGIGMGLMLGAAVLRRRTKRRRSP